MLKIGAFGSLFIATIYLESLIPAKCCIAPDIPQAIYNSGLTVVPV